MKFRLQRDLLKKKAFQSFSTNPLKYIPGILLITYFLISCATTKQTTSGVKPIKVVSIGKNRVFMVNNKPFFPIMSWAQPKKNYAMLQGLGFNAHAGGADPEAAQAVNTYAIPGFKTDFKNLDYILGWIFDDEPDMPSGRGAEAKPRQQPEKVYARTREIKAASAGRPLLMTLTGHFSREQSTYPLEVREKIYPEYIKGTDVVGFDIYPIYGSGYASHLDWVGKGVAQLRQLAGDRPVYAWIETSKGSKWMNYEVQPDVLPVHTRNEVWQAIIQGATAIGYFTHAWRPDFKEFAPTVEMQQELSRLNAQLTRLAPAILADPSKKKVTMSLAQNLNCHFKATQQKKDLYIFAQNIDLGPGAAKAKQFDPIYPRGGKATFTVEGLKRGTRIEVVDEQRSIIAEDGRFTDEFAPLAEHIYHLKD